MNNENIKEILKNIGAEKLPADVQKIAEKTCEDFGEALIKSKQPRIHNLGDYIMKSRMIKLAAAAVIFIIVIAGIQFTTSTSQVALADVLEKVEQARSFMYRMKMTMTGNIPGVPTGQSEMDYTVFISDDHGMKMELEMTNEITGMKTTGLTYILPEKKVACVITPEMKKYMDMKFDDNMFAKSKQESNDPRVLIERMMNCEYTPLGRSVVEGVEVEGFHTTDPNFAVGMTDNIDFTLWVDIDKWLPVYAEMDFELNEQMHVHSVIYDYQWDVTFDEGEFEPNIPDDYTPMTEMQPDSGQTSQEKAVEALKMFAEISGKYPKKIDMMNLMQDFFELRDQGIKNNRGLLDSGMTLEEEMANPTTKAEHIKKAMDTFGTFQSLAMFYMTLMEDKKEPVYYGETVGPDDVDAVLLRWKISENEYRVIFGDLTVENVTAERLAELEELLQN